MYLDVNEIFTSVKGEGVHVGKLMTFIRTSKCNLSCTGCDTDHEKGMVLHITAILQRVKEDSTNYVVLTGGEPLIQDSESVTQLVAELHKLGKLVHIESNGTMFFNYGMFDWVAVSPKLRVDETPGLEHAHEVKVLPQDFYVYAHKDGTPKWDDRKTHYLYIQPWAEGKFIPPREILQALQLVHKHPQWRYSVQLHKYLGVK